MGWTKRQIIEDAFGELRLAGHDFDLTPDEQQAAARRLEVLMAHWSDRGIRLGYVHAADPSAIDLDEDSGVQLRATMAVICNLARSLAAVFGKALHPSTLANASEGFGALLSLAAMPEQQQLPASLPRGAGSKAAGLLTSVFMTPPDGSPIGSPSGGLDFKG